MKKRIILLFGLLGIFCLTSCYDFNREQQQKDAESNGKAILLEAESSKKAMIEEAKAKSESSILASQARLKVAENDALATIKKAEAEAQSIEAIGKAINGNPEYIKYLQIQSIKGNKGDKYFIPTEANVPILIK
ncbi:hypothetical protein [Riemerella anatipestifer]|uniref:hypothetical protein n=1 Tax=Riemerella anatipestifer TaxID=34085 RepID=UPI00129E90E4|nr:hypothetical protein [Riemerella anatipestifer]MRM83378.1 hypothetical protein [Riemerella anatipestifer]